MKRILLIVVLSSCRRDAQVVAVDAGAPAATVAVAAAEFVLTPEKVDRYLKYQKALAAAANTDDRAAQEEAAMKTAGLSETEVQKIDDMVSAVVARRITMQAAPIQMPADVTAMAAKLSPEQKKLMDEALASYRQQQEAAKALTDERRRFGSRNVDVLLTREAELTQAWGQLMGLGALAPPAP